MIYASFTLLFLFANASIQKASAGQIAQVFVVTIFVPQFKELFATNPTSRSKKQHLGTRWYPMVS
jgi:hypothetical protein